MNLPKWQQQKQYNGREEGGFSWLSSYEGNGLLVLVILHRFMDLSVTYNQGGYTRRLHVSNWLCLGSTLHAQRSQSGLVHYSRIANMTLVFIKFCQWVRVLHCDIFQLAIEVRGERIIGTCHLTPFHGFQRHIQLGSLHQMPRGLKVAMSALVNIANMMMLLLLNFGSGYVYYNVAFSQYSMFGYFKWQSCVLVCKGGGC